MSDGIRESPVVQNKKRTKRKKNSRFLRNAKGFAKQGIYGRGTFIQEDEYNYFINILDSMKSGFEELEDKVNLANNVFEQTIDQEIHLASNQIVCKVLESLLGFVDAEVLERFFKAFGENLRPICSDRFASHVLQKMVEIAFLRKCKNENLKGESDTDGGASVSKRPKLNDISEESYNSETNFTEEHKSKCCDFVEKIGKFMLNNLEDFIWDPCANHIMRTCILSLGGVHVPKIAFEKGRATDITKDRKLYSVPNIWTDILKEFPQRLEMWPQFADLPFRELSSALLGTICIALKATDKNVLKHFGKKILNDALIKVHANEASTNSKLDNDEEKFKKNTESLEETKEQVSNQNKNLPAVFECQPSVILLETLISVAGPKLFTQIYALLFLGRFALLARDQLTNFSVQKILQNINEKNDFENIFTELSDETEELLKIGHTGVIVSLASACLRLTTRQAQMVGALQTALHISGDKEKSKQFFQCVLKLKPYEIVKDDKSSFVHLHGSLILQSILKFNKPIFLVTCILETPAEQLVTIFNTPNGSHITNAFLESKFIGEKSREKLIKTLEGFYIDLAVTKHGSRVIENFFSAAQDAQKLRIIKELADKLNMLKGSPFGRLLHNKFRIDTYRLSPSQWKASRLQQENKATQIFKDIVN